MLEDETRFRAELDCRLKELDLLQSEIDDRLERQANSFNYCVALLAAVIVGTATAFTVIDNTGTSGHILLPLLFVPWLAMPLASMFFDDELVLGITAFHIDSQIIPEIRALLKREGCDTSKIFAGTIGYRLKLPRDSNMPPKMAATARPILFLIPFIAAVTALFTLMLQLHHHEFYYVGRSELVIAVGGLTDLFLFILFVRMWAKSVSLWQQIGVGGSLTPK